MKKIKLILALFVVLIGTTILSNCQHNDFDELNQEAEHLEKKKPTKFIYYQGLKVKHRFKSTEKELKVKHNKKSLKALYYKMKVKKKNGSISQGKKIKSSYEINNESFEEEELPSNEAIVEAAKVVLPSFPYEEIEGYAVINRPNKHALDHGMVKQDFPDLTDAEIEANESIIDQYYSDNLDYMVLDEIAENPSVYNGMGTQHNNQAKGSSELSTATCTIGRAVTYGYGFVRSTISYLLAGKNAEDSSVNHYPSIGSSNTREDAYRHMLWNAMLAQYYFTISSKAPRLGFAKLVTDAREISCSTGNAIDAKEMDLHNNVIGRNIWDEKTSYIKVFGVTVGLYKPSMSLLKTLIFNKVERNSCYIVKDHPSGVVYDYNETEVQTLISQTDVNTPVYFIGTIAPITYIGSIELEYYDCDENNDDFIPKQKSEDVILYSKVPDETGQCSREIIVYTPVIPCYITKDTNYNPY